MSSESVTNGSQTKRGLGRWQKPMLVGIVVVNLCVYGAMFLLVSAGRSTQSSPEPTTGKSIELKTALEQSLVVAAGWQSDAQLVGATASWQLTAGDRLTLHRPAWSFSYYSPTAHKVQIVTVDQRGAQFGPEQPVDVAPQRAGLDWHLNSDDLLLIFLSYGGQEFLSSHSSVNIHLQLKADETGRSIWYVTAIDPVARRSLIVGIDARSREVVLSETNGGNG